MKRILETVSSNKATIYVTLFVCLILRVAYAWHSRHVPAEGDGALYSAIADSIAAGKGVVWQYHVGGPIVPTAWGCPLYPAFLAVVYRLFSHAPLAVYLAQALLDTLTCFFIFRTALLFTKRPIAAVLAAVCYAFYVPFIMMTTTFWADTLGYFCLALAVYALVVAEKKGGWHFAIAGILMGLSILVKPALLGFPVFLAIMLFVIRKQRRGLVLGAVVLLIASYITVAPWTLRNYLVFHRFIPVASHGGQTLWGGTGPADGKTLTCWNAPIESVDLNPSNDSRVTVVSHPTYLRLTAFQQKLDGLDEISRNDALMSAAKAEIRQHPGRYAILGVKKFFRLWFHLMQDGHKTRKFILVAVVNSVLMLLAVLGYRSWGAARILPWTTLTLAIYTSISAMVTFSHIRYSYPVFPFIIILAVIGVLRLLGDDRPAEAKSAPDPREKALA